MERSESARLKEIEEHPLESKLRSGRDLEKTQTVEALEKRVQELEQHFMDGGRSKPVNDPKAVETLTNLFIEGGDLAMNLATNWIIGFTIFTITVLAVLISYWLN